MILIGITGSIGHGKTSLAEAFLKIEPSAIHDESSKLISEFANEAKMTLPDVFDVQQINNWLSDLTGTISDVLHVDINSKLPLIPESTNPKDPEFIKLSEYISSLNLNKSLREEKVTEETKPNHRALLQWIGGYFVNHISRTIWYDELIRRSETAEQNDCKLYIIGGLRFPEDAEVIKKAGGKVIEVIRPNAPQPDVNDPTERERANITCDIRVINDGSLDGLATVAAKIYNDINHNTFDSIYTSRL